MCFLQAHSVAQMQVAKKGKWNEPKLELCQGSMLAETTHKENSKAIPMSDYKVEL